MTTATRPAVVPIDRTDLVCIRADLLLGATVLEDAAKLLDQLLVADDPRRSLVEEARARARDLRQSRETVKAAQLAAGAITERGA